MSESVLFGEKYFNANEKKGVTFAFEPFLKDDQDEVEFLRNRMSFLMWATILSTIIMISLELFAVCLRAEKSIIYSAAVASIIVFYRLLHLYLKSCDDYKRSKAEKRKRADQFLIASIYSNISAVELADKMIKQCDFEKPQILPLFEEPNELNKSAKSETSLLKALRMFNL